MRLRKKTAQQGYTLIEVAIALAILVLVSQTFVIFIGNMGKRGREYMDRMLAQEKALQMLEEMRKVVAEGEYRGQDVGVLNDYDSKGSYSYMLTTDVSLTMTPVGGEMKPDPDQWKKADTPLSGNPITKEGYYYVRTISVVTPPNDLAARRVLVRVFKAKVNPGKASLSTPLPFDASKPMAEAFSLMRSSGSDEPPTQVMDVYMVAIESVPGWWVRLAALRELMASMSYSMQARNPGLSLRMHWIKRMSYGRDQEYTPEINQAADATDQYALRKTYIYPGTVTYDSAPLSPNLYYEPSYFSARMNIDGVVANLDSYSLADQWNHCMRFEDEKERWLALASADSNQAEPSLRLLLDFMNTYNPGDYFVRKVQNSIIINLHGELLPVPPLRNVSDPAKDPEAFPGETFRVVSHPTKLRFNTATEDPTIGVYAYAMCSTCTAETDIIDVVTLFFEDLDTSNLEEVQRLQGLSTVGYKWFSYPGVLDDPTFIADEYTPPGRRSGLRIRLFGVTPTARAYSGPLVP